MDKLKLAFSIVAKKAKEQRARGQVPTVLGVRGMLALMFDRIASFSQEDESDSDYVLDLAVKGMFAMAECLPDLDVLDEIDDDEPDDDRLPEDIEGSEPTEEETEEEEDNDDPRWTKSKMGEPK